MFDAANARHSAIFQRVIDSNNNDYSNRRVNVYGAVIMAEPLWEFTWFIWWMQNSIRWPLTFGPSQSTWTAGPPMTAIVSTFTIAIYYYTHLEIWYLFYHATEGRRLSQPGWLVTYRDGLPVRRRSPIQVVTGPGVEQLRWGILTRYHNGITLRCGRTRANELRPRCARPTLLAAWWVWLYYQPRYKQYAS